MMAQTFEKGAKALKTEAGTMQCVLESGRTIKFNFWSFDAGENSIDVWLYIGDVAIGCVDTRSISAVVATGFLNGED